MNFLVVEIVLMDCIVGVVYAIPNLLNVILTLIETRYYCNEKNNDNRRLWAGKRFSMLIMVVVLSVRSVDVTSNGCPKTILILPVLLIGTIDTTNRT